MLFYLSEGSQNNKNDLLLECVAVVEVLLHLVQGYESPHFQVLGEGLQDLLVAA